MFLEIGVIFFSSFKAQAQAEKVDKNESMLLQVNYGDGAEPPARGGGDDGDWQDDMSNYNSDFSVPSDDDNDDGDFDDRNADIDMPGRRGGRGQKSQKVRKTRHYYVIASAMC